MADSSLDPQTRPGYPRPGGCPPRPLAHWRRHLAADSGPWRTAFAALYGDDESLLQDRRRAWLALLDTFEASYGAHAGPANPQAGVLLIRAPARINIMGVHIDHRKGEVNYLTHRREVLMVAQPRTDDTVRLCNADPAAFAARSFSLREEIARGGWDDWMTYIESPGVTQTVADTQGDWANYVKSSVLRLQHWVGEPPVRGMDLAVAGDIPLSAGLSSSSAVVVATAVACVALNDIDVAPAQLVDLCGEGEWYVGTRGGAGDHAAMLFGRRGLVSHVGFFPCRLLCYVPAPEGCDVVVCNSLRQARKSKAELSAYNETIAAYRTVLMLMKEILRDQMGFDRSLLEERVRHLGDFSLNRDLFPDAVLYRLLKLMPPLITREELLTRLPDERDALAAIFKTHDPPPHGYRPRPVAMFGLSEIARGAACVDLLRAGDLHALGELMYVSHDGDRIATWDSCGRTIPWDNEATRVTDTYLDRLIADLQSGDASRARAAQLMFQPGGYRCSSEELDEIVDVCKSTEGVLGAGLTGAGFGGCVLALVERRSTLTLLAALQARYYGPRSLPFAAEPCVPVEGAGVIGLG
jgi:N-acetylgalactosamine kinase